MNVEALSLHCQMANTVIVLLQVDMFENVSGAGAALPR